ncbi:hypothetical protein TNCV_1799691 [Trichonephila clavipes]|nr:hypothetical protein TNCV_1799691 [Trichonephila clavipes]
MSQNETRPSSRVSPLARTQLTNALRCFCLAPLKTHRVADVTHVKSIEAQSPPIGVMRKFREGVFIYSDVMFATSSWTATAGSDVVQSGRPIFDDFFQHLWPYIGNNTVNVVFQMVKRLWLIRIDQ